MIRRRRSKLIRIGNVTIGGDAPIRVQSMTKTDTRNIKDTIRQIKELESCDCEIVRIAVPDTEAVAAIPKIKKATSLPIIADIHFDYRLALAALQTGVDGLRLNPGNIRDQEQITRIIQSAKERQIPIRVGVNAGSLPSIQNSNTSIIERMVKTALDYTKSLESLDFNLIKVSLKAFDVPSTIAAYQMIAERIPYPLHVGITEAGLPKTGSIRSAVGTGILLYQGIGDTIRVSLSTHPCEEVAVAYEILKSLDIRQHGPILLSCPSCGRAEVDIISLAQAVEKQLSGIREPIKVAVMGCVVNGPGEAKDADVGIACGRGKGAIFKKGRVVSTVTAGNFLEALMKEIFELIRKNGKL